MTFNDRTVVFQMPSVISGQLTCFEGTMAGHTYDLSAGTFVIGRRPDCDLPLTVEPGVSKTHAKIIAEGDHYFLEDTESRNGTIVNGQPVQRIALQDGDVIQICGCRLRFHLLGGEEPEHTPTHTEPMRDREGGRTTSSPTVPITFGASRPPPPPPEAAMPSEVTALADMPSTEAYQPIEDEPPPFAAYGDLEPPPPPRQTVELETSEILDVAAVAPVKEVQKSAFPSFVVGFASMLAVGFGAYAVLLSVDDGKLFVPDDLSASVTAVTAEEEGKASAAPDTEAQLEKPPAAEEPGAEDKNGVEGAEPAAAPAPDDDPGSAGGSAKPSPSEDIETKEPAAPEPVEAAQPEASAPAEDEPADSPDEDVASKPLARTAPVAPAQSKPKAPAAKKPAPIVEDDEEPEAAPAVAADEKSPGAVAQPAAAASDGNWLPATYVEEKRAVLRAPSGGSVKSVDVIEGTVVTKGQVLARFETTADPAQIATLKVSISALRDVVESGGSKKAEEQLREEEAKLAGLQSAQRSAALRAPSGGKLVDFAIKAGDTVRSQQTVGFIDPVTGPRVVVTVSAKKAKGINPGLTVTVKDKNGNEGEGEVIGSSRRGKNFEIEVTTTAFDPKDVVSVSLD